jgi:DNA polymerase III subunit delta
VAAKTNSTRTFIELRKEIRSGKTRPIYFLCGEETFYLDAIQEEIMRLMPADLKAFNFDVLYGTEVRLDKVLTIARSFPMMAERRIVILRDFSALFDKMPASDDNDEDTGVSSIEPLFTYLARPNPSTILVFVDKKLLAGNTKLGIAFQKNEQAHYAVFDPISVDELPEWIIEWTRHNHQRTIEPRAAQVLAGNTGSDLLLLSTEIDKLCTFKDTSLAITDKDVHQLVGFSRQISVFELKEALIKRNIPQSLQIAEQILHTTKTTDVGEVLRIVSFFYSMFSNIWQIKRLSDKGIPLKEIQGALGVKSDFYFQNLVKEARSFRSDQMPLIFEALLDADKALKGMGKMDAREILFLLIKRIAV